MEPVQPYNRDRLLELLLERHARPVPEVPQEIKGVGETGVEPEDPGNEGKSVKVVKLPGRQANPRRLQLWQSLDSNRAHFDACLRASDREVYYNSLLLAEESVFFAAKFSNPDFGGSQKVVQLEDVDGGTLENVVEALLTAYIKLDRDNIERYLHCADMLQLSAVKDACCVYMKDCLDEDSAATTLSLSAKYSCDSLHEHTQSYIVANFHNMRPDALKECTRPVFWDLISRDDLSIYSEVQVLTAVTVWCDHNGPEAFLGLLPAVRLENVSAYELQSMSQHAMVLEHPPAIEQVHAALAALYSPNSPQRNPKQAPRKLRGKVAKVPPRRLTPPGLRRFLPRAPPYDVRPGPFAQHVPLPDPPQAPLARDLPRDEDLARPPWVRVQRIAEGLPRPHWAQNLGGHQLDWPPRQPGLQPDVQLAALAEPDEEEEPEEAAGAEGARPVRGRKATRRR
ncbi:probable Kelch-like protein 6 at N-terminal half [Coccomyxa sp. Obi]|nr:probable Kelch-like protein 6 at N-terminal half [Coccomyxa sp. Obi]